MLRHPVEQVRRTAIAVVFPWVMHQHLQGKLPEPRIVDPFGQLPSKHALVDRHEEIGQVALEVEARPRPVLRLAADLRFHSLAGVQRAAPWDTGAAVRYEAALDGGADAVVQQVVNDAVAEVGGPHLAGLWPGYHKADRSARPVGASLEIVE